MDLTIAILDRFYFLAIFIFIFFIDLAILRDPAARQLT